MKLSDGSGLEHEEENIEMLQLGIYDAMKMIETGGLMIKKRLCYCNM